MMDRYPSPPAPPGISQAESKTPNVVDSVMAELHGFEAMADELASDLHTQADRLFGQEPAAAAGPAPQTAANGPAFQQMADVLMRIRAKLIQANGGVRRLRKIG